MESIKIETTQNVLIEHDIANIGIRILAALIDIIFMFVYFLIIIFIIAFITQISHNQDLFYIVYVLLFIPIMFYSIACELIFHGQTFGKMITKIKVVRVDGREPTLGSYLLRWVMRLVDIWFSNGIVGLITIIANGRGQRLGDIAAGTSVVSLKKTSFFQHSIYKQLPDNYTLKIPEVEKLSEQDIKTINEVLKAYRINRNDTIRNLLFLTNEEVKKKMNIKNDLPPMLLLDTLLKDYNFIHKID